MREKCVIVVVGSLPILDYLSEQVRIASEALGYVTYTIDINNPYTYGDNLNRIIANYKSLVYGFNQVGSLLTDDDGSNFWVKNNISFISHIVDHPSNFADAFDRPLKCLKVNVTDRLHQTYINRFYPQINSVRFVPNGGTIGNDYCLQYQERPIDVLFVGKYLSEDVLFPPCDFWEDKGSEFISVCISVLKDNPNISVEEVIELYCNNVLNNCEESHIKQLCEVYSPLITRTIANYYRREIIRTLEGTGANIHIYGDGWESIDGWGKNVHIHPFVSPNEYIRLLTKSKICMNVFYWFKDGSNERVFNIMLNGAVCVTDISDYLLERFEQGNQIVYYELDKLDDLSHNVRWLLDNPDQAEKIALRGMEATRNTDTWESRLKSILAEEFM